MEKLLVLTHVDESGVALTKASLEAVAAGVEFAGASGAALSIGIVGAETGTAANSVAGASARVLTVFWRGIRTSALRKRCRGLRSTVPRGRSDTGVRTVKLALCTGDSRCGLSARRFCGYSYHCTRSG